jgi:alkyldihydroxyacetonephosphate synthase
MAERRFKYFGWGRESEGMAPEEEAFALQRLGKRFGMERFEDMPPPRLEEINLGAPRITPPASLASICSTELYDRVVHTYGKAYPDYVRGLNGDCAPAPYVVAYPRSDAEVAAILDWAGAKQAAVTPLRRRFRPRLGVRPTRAARASCRPVTGSSGGP